MIKEIPVSIVVTSIGEDILLENLKNLTSKYPKINEILVIIPEEFKKSEFIDFDNVKFYFTKSKGQVTQRIYGFKKAKNNYVLQLDCDCFISNSDIEKMYLVLLNLYGTNYAIAPVYYCDKSNKSIHEFTVGFWSNIKNILTYFICGSKYSIFKMGTVSNIGTNYGVDPNYMFNDIFISEWVPGGCVMHYKENLITHNYYPFKGKAYSEDLIHSFFLRNKKIQLLVTKKSKCYTEQPFVPKEFSEFKKFLKVQKYYWKLLKNNNYVKFYIWRILNYLRFIVQR
tara:strand:- start:151 stop:999 length:849 start_codon:yes stop_codon:yes gene_type:complete